MIHTTCLTLSYVYAAHTSPRQHQAWPLIFAAQLRGLVGLADDKVGFSKLDAEIKIDAEVLMYVLIST